MRRSGSVINPSISACGASQRSGSCLAGQECVVALQTLASGAHRGYRSTMHAIVDPLPPGARRLIQRVVLIAGSAMLAACGTLAPPSPPQASRPPPVVEQRTPAERQAALPAALSAERQWLQSWFDGTPVLIVQRSDGAVAIDVPIEFCFDPGQSRIKPALAAVLDKVAESMRRVRDAELPVVAAPADADGRRALAVQRANQVRRHLRSRGVAAARLGPATIATVAAVQLRIDSGDD